jgi:hypothetical protein
MTSTPTVNLGPVQAGTYTVTLTAVGTLSGCNSGYLQSWEGTLSVTTSPITTTTTLKDFEDFLETAGFVGGTTALAGILVGIFFF